MIIDGPRATIERLARATNDHDLEALVACFAHDYLNETPTHPSRGFRGSDQVRRNWQQIFEFVPDISATVTRCVVEGSSAWTEWDMHGTRRDGTSHHMSGVIIFDISDDVVRRATFYLEPVDVLGTTVTEAVHDQVAR